MKPGLHRYRLRHRTRPLDVWVAGEGPPLVLLHGWGLAGPAYKRAMLAIADRGHRVVAPSISVSERWTIERASETVAEALAGLDAAPAPIIGHSFGGAVGAQVAVDHPDFVTAFVAVSSPLVSLGRVRLGRIALPGQHYRVVVHGAAAAALLGSVAQRGGVASLWRAARWFLNDHQDRALERLAATSVPRAIVWPVGDTLLPHTVGARAAEVLGCELHVIAGDNGWPGDRPPDHDWPFREPEHFADTVLKIVGGLTS